MKAIICPPATQLSPGSLPSSHGHHQRLFFLTFAQQIWHHEGGEEVKLHSIGELEQLQVDAEHPLKYSWQVNVNVLVLGKQNGIWRFSS